MAQLSDDCFAFGGPMMSVDEAVGLIAARVTPVVDVETVSLAARRWAHSRARRSGTAAAAALHQFRRRWLCGCEPRPAAEGRAGIPGHRTRSGRRRRAGTAHAWGGDAHLHRRADARGRRYRVHAGGRARRRRQSRASRGAQTRRQCAPGGRRHSVRRCRAESRSAAAAAGCRACGGVRPDATRCRQALAHCGVLHRQRAGLAGRSRAPRRNCSIPTASC